jgi:hypothetical protein
LRKFVVGAVAITSLMMGLSAAAFALPASALQAGYVPTVQTGHIEQVDYWYHHHRYHHRRWDRKHRRWYYY